MVEMHKWHGFRELEQNLLKLGRDVHERGVKRMMSRAAVPIRDDARRRAPVLSKPDPRRMPGTLRNAIQIWRKRITPYAVTYYVGVRGLSRKVISRFKSNTDRQGKALKGSDNPRDPFYWLWVELGTSKMAARPFLRPAFESQKMASVQVALDEGRKFIRATVRKFKRVAQRTTA